MINKDKVYDEHEILVIVLSKNSSIKIITLELQLTFSVFVMVIVT